MKRSIKRNMIKQKIAEYQRTSSGGQDLELQRSTNADYLKAVSEEDILQFVDYDVSATKLPIDSRPAINRMLKLIENGYISTVVCYDRDRFARNVYEYIFIVKKFYEYDIKVIFTATDAPSFSDDLFVETWYGLSAQFEGQRIKTRLSDAYKRNPSSMIGYKKTVKKIDDETKQRIYEADPELKGQLYNLFKEFSEIKEHGEVFEIIMRYKNLLKRSEFRVMDILKTPFFSAHFEGMDGSYHQLANVEPIISLELFQKVQDKLTEFEYDISKGITISQQEGKLIPVCGKCHEKLKFKSGNMGQHGTYYCKKHRKISINVNELNNTIIESINAIKNRISFASIKRITKKAINKLIKELNESSESIGFELEDRCIKFSHEFNPSDESHSNKRAMEKIDQLREKLYETEDNILALQTLLDEVDLLEDFAKHQLEKLDNEDKFLLAELLIENIIIHQDHIQFNYYFNEFFKGDDMSDVS